MSSGSLVRFIYNSNVIAEREWHNVPRRGEMLHLHNVLDRAAATFFLVDRVTWEDDEQVGEVQIIHLSRLDDTGTIILPNC